MCVLIILWVSPLKYKSSHVFKRYVHSLSECHPIQKMGMGRNTVPPMNHHYLPELLGNNGNYSQHGPK